jgi:hypothetical protein
VSGSNPLTELVSDTDWISELRPYQRNLVHQLSPTVELSEESVIAWFESFGNPSTTAQFSAGSRSRPYYEKFVEQLYRLLCSPNHYIEERAQIAKDFKAGQTTLSTAIATAIAPHMDATPTVLVPAVAISLTLAGKMTLNAWCEVQKEKREND